MKRNEFENINKKCPICDGQISFIFSNLPGYQEPLSFNVISCSVCGVSFVDPMKSDNHIYELIYRNSWRLPGYFEYSVYAEEVLRANDPLSYLEQASPVYLSISNYLKKKSSQHGLKILEIGSGMGYLTYAISKRGMNIVGIDLSQVVVDKARKRYGDLFMCGDIIKGLPDQVSLFDIIICTEVIEHVENPVVFLAAMRNFLTEGGELVMTTPNRHAFPKEAVWESDIPPVHLWWFTTKSLEILGKQAGFVSVTIEDPPQQPQSQMRIDPTRNYTLPKCKPIFDKHGKICFEGNFTYMLRLSLRNIARRVRFLSWFQKIKRKLIERTTKSSILITGVDVNICVVLKNN